MLAPLPRPRPTPSCRRARNWWMCVPQPELLFVGRVPGSLLVEWQTYPGNQLNAEFLDQLAQVAGPQDTLMYE